MRNSDDPSLCPRAGRPARPAHAREQTFTCKTVRYALEHNNEIRAAGSSLAAQGGRRGGGPGNLLPKVYFEERALRTNNPTYAFMAKAQPGPLHGPGLCHRPPPTNPNPVNDYQTLFAAAEP